jgi:hypothetical protein
LQAGAIEGSELHPVTHCSGEDPCARHPACSIVLQALWHADITASCEQLLPHVASDPPPPPSPEMTTEPPHPAPHANASANTEIEKERANEVRADMACMLTRREGGTQERAARMGPTAACT